MPNQTIVQICKNAEVLKQNIKLKKSFTIRNVLKLCNNVYFFDCLQYHLLFRHGGAVNRAEEDHHDLTNDNGVSRAAPGFARSAIYIAKFSNHFKKFMDMKLNT